MSRKRRDLRFEESLARKVDALGERANVHYAGGNMRAGQVMFTWRMMNKKTVADVAKEIGVTVSTIRRLEAGSQFPDGHNVIKIINWLFSDEKEEPDAESENTSRPESVDSPDGQTDSLEDFSGGGN